MHLKHTYIGACILSDTNKHDTNTISWMINQPLSAEKRLDLPNLNCPLRPIHTSYNTKSGSSVQSHQGHSLSPPSPFRYACAWSGTRCFQIPRQTNPTKVLCSKCSSVSLIQKDFVLVKNPDSVDHIIYRNSQTHSWTKNNVERQTNDNASRSNWITLVSRVAILLFMHSPLWILICSWPKDNSGKSTILNKYIYLGCDDKSPSFTNIRTLRIIRIEWHRWMRDAIIIPAPPQSVFYFRERVAAWRIFTHINIISILIIPIARIVPRWMMR